MLTPEAQGELELDELHQVWIQGIPYDLRAGSVWPDDKQEKYKAFAAEVAVWFREFYLQN
jgi:hypothetical protein